MIPFGRPSTTTARRQRTTPRSRDAPATAWHAARSESTSPPSRRRGGVALDFGCGTGLDAEWYAARGFTVVAYDISSTMLDCLRIRCVREIAVQRIIPVVGDADALSRAVRAAPPIETVAANFAVLNHCADLHATITRLADFVLSDGSIIASLLSPFHGSDLGVPRWRSQWMSATITSPSRSGL